MLKWYLIYTKSRCEDSVAFKLSEKGFTVFNPKIKNRRYIRRKLQDVIAPLFPGYLFARFDKSKDYRLIKYTRGVRSIVGTDNVPTDVPYGIIDSIRQRCDDGVICIRPDSFTAGQNVHIKAGPFEGFDAVFQREMKGTERVSILLKIINARVIVDRALLEKADA